MKRKRKQLCDAQLALVQIQILVQDLAPGAREREREREGYICELRSILSSVVLTCNFKQVNQQSKFRTNIAALSPAVIWPDILW